MQLLRRLRAPTLRHSHSDTHVCVDELRDQKQCSIAHSRCLQSRLKIIQKNRPCTVRYVQQSRHRKPAISEWAAKARAKETYQRSLSGKTWAPREVSQGSAHIENINKRIKSMIECQSDSLKNDSRSLEWGNSNQLVFQLASLRGNFTNFTKKGKREK